MKGSDKVSNNKEINVKKLLIIVSIVILFTLTLIGRTITRYIGKEKNETAYIAQSFYFESSLLSDSSTVPSYTLKNQVDSISIDLNNFEDNLRYSDVAIDYIVSITDLNGNQVNDKNDNLIPNKTGQFSAKSKTTKNEEFSNLKKGTYIVTAQAVSPYTKTIKANFIILGSDEDISYFVSDVNGSSVMKLTVTTSEYNGNIRISWPNGLAPDSTDPKLASINSGFSAGECTVHFEAYSEYTFQFFKQNPTQKFEKNDLTVGRE